MSLQNLKSEITIHSTLKDKIDDLKQELTTLKKQKNNIEQSILTTITELHLENKKLNLDEYCYTISNTKISPNLTLELLREICIPLIGDHSTTLIISHIKKYKSKNKKVIPYLKRKQNIKLKHSHSKKNGINRISNNYSLKKTVL